MIKLHQKQLGVSVKKIHADNGSEFVTNSLKGYCADNGIIFETSPAYNPELNGLTERCQRSLLKKARCLLSESALPMYFWSLALTQATLLYNLSAHRKLKWKSPWEITYGNESLLKTRTALKIFGSSVIVFPKLKDIIRKKIDRGHKFSSRSHRGIYIGDGSIGEIIVFCHNSMP